VTASTFADALTEQLRTEPGRPFVTFYDDASGERIELSVTTYANWVAKTAGLLQDELDLARGATVLLDLPTHWLGPVWLGAVWTLGLVATRDTADAKSCDLVVCGPEGVEEYAASAAAPVVALSLRPLGAPFAETLPTGVVDYSAVVLGQPDDFIAYDPPRGADEAWRGERSRTQQDLLGDARGASVVGPGGRLLTDLNPCTEGGLATLVGPLVLGGSAVWVRHPDDAAWQHRADSERATTTLRGGVR